MSKTVFKNIMILVLCIVISIPANAAVSVSDGSAFVTKAEFSADLNNLSNRMAQLENSLDAKIDSLVSSYLTRNGIWNGARQDIVTTDCPFPTPATLRDPVSVIVYDISTNGTKYELFKSNKSGMVFLVGSYNSNTTSWARHWWGYGLLCHSNSSGKNLYDDSLVAGLYFLDDNDVVMTVYSLGGGRAISNYMNGVDTNGRYNLAFALPKDPTTIVSNFFVEKDKKYYFQFRAVVTAGFDTNSGIQYSNGSGRYQPLTITVY